MKRLLFFLFMLVGFFAEAQTENPNYDKVLADSLGADEYGMRPYIFVILKTGTHVIDDKEQVATIFKGHLDNINRLVGLGKLIVAGPFKKNEKSYRGLFILTVKTIDEAKMLLETDPAIKAKLLAPELYEWYGSAALPLYLNASKKIEKKSF